MVIWYFQEPYSRQENLTRDNFALRDYYKGAVSGDTYLGNVIISASSALPAVLMSIPLYSANESNSSEAKHSENLIGLLGVNQGISTFNKFLHLFQYLKMKLQYT